MSQQKNGSIFLAAFFMVVSVAGGIIWGVSHSKSSASLTELDAARNEATSAKDSVRKLTAEKTALLTLIGREGETNTETVTTEIGTKLSGARLSTLTNGANSLETAVDKAATDRDIQAGAANSRKIDLQNKIAELAETIASKDQEISVHQEGREKAELELQQQAARHRENIVNLRNEFVELQATLRQTQTDFNKELTEARRLNDILREENREKRQAVRSLRRRLFEKDDVSFATADGIVSSVDQISGRVYINLGRKDELQEGTTFSVYMASHNGIGRRNSSDIKASIEVVAISGPHLAEAKITHQDLDRPIAKGDPIYSPIFTVGLPVEVAVAGLIDFDGSPGSDRDELLRMITDRGAIVNVQVNDEGEFMTRSGEPMTEQEASDSITETTRFLVIADLGKNADEDSTNDVRLKTYRQMQKNTGVLQRQAENHGVYEIGLSAFLEFLGYTRKRTAWRAGQTFDAKLANGAKSPSVNTPAGHRVSTGATSARYSNRRQPSPTTQGQVSALYK